MESVYKQIVSLAKQYGAAKVILFGSRARGDHRENSDIDLAVYGMPYPFRPDFSMQIEELPTLLKFDIVHIRPGMDEEFLKKLEKDGVVLYAKD